MKDMHWLYANKRVLEKGLDHLQVLVSTGESWNQSRKDTLEKEADLCSRIPERLLTLGNETWNGK
jgi:hypothetical protein